MEKDYKNIYQFHILLEGIKPRIWRRIQVPETYTFWDLHCAIQDSMGWFDCHLHDFRTIENRPSDYKRISVPNPDFEDDPLFKSAIDWQEKIKDWFSLENRKAMKYEYDFGDGWEHRIELEKILPKEEGVSYPLLITGKNACPPEDCGGIGGYYHMLETLQNPDDPEYKEIKEWLGGDLDPKEFDLEDFGFLDPDERLEEVKQGIGWSENDDNNKSENQTFNERIKNINDNASKKDMVIEIDYSKSSEELVDESGARFKPYLFLIVEPQSRYCFALQFIDPRGDYLSDFLNILLEVCENNKIRPSVINVKKLDLFFTFSKISNLLDFNVEIVKRTSAIEQFKRTMTREMDSPM